MVSAESIESRIFLSWSGVRSGAVARVFRDWLPCAIQNVRPYYNPEDTGKGSRWSDEIRGELERSDFGIICLTPENLSSQWLLFESGALSKLGRARVAPFLVDLKPTDVSGPLAQFQATQPTHDDCFRLVKSLNESLGERGLDSVILGGVFDHWWPDLTSKLQAAMQAEPVQAGAVQRSPRDLAEETLERIRRMEVQSSITSKETLAAVRQLEALMPVGESESLVVYETAQTMWRAIEDVLERIVIDLQQADDECSARCLSLVREIESAALGFTHSPHRMKGG